MERAVGRCFEKWGDTFPGLSLHREKDHLVIDIPDHLRTTHEEHFCQVRDMYLGYLSRGQYPAETRPALVSKYTLLTQALKLAMASPFEPLQP